VSTFRSKDEWSPPVREPWRECFGWTPAGDTKISPYAQYQHNPRPVKNKGNGSETLIQGES